MKKALLFALLFLAIGGFLLHYRVHPYMVADKMHPGTFIFSDTLFLAFIFPLVDVVLVTVLFLFRRTAMYGYLLNGLIVIYGTVFMAHFSIAEFMREGIPWQEWWMKSTFPDIFILWADFFVGKTLYDLYIRRIDDRFFGRGYV